MWRKFWTQQCKSNQYIVQKEEEMIEASWNNGSSKFPISSFSFNSVYRFFRTRLYRRCSPKKEEQQADRAALAARTRMANASLPIFNTSFESKTCFSLRLWLGLSTREKTACQHLFYYFRVYKNERFKWDPCIKYYNVQQCKATENQEKNENCIVLQIQEYKASNRGCYIQNGGKAVMHSTCGVAKTHTEE